MGVACRREDQEMEQVLQQAGRWGFEEVPLILSSDREKSDKGHR
jgi:hypothetical protein